MKKPLLSFLLFLSISIPVLGQGYSIKKYDVNDGLPSNDIKNLEIDPKGYLWMLTENGLCSYDSKTFTSYISKETFFLGFSFDSGDGMPGITGADARSFRCLNDGSVIFQAEDSLITFKNSTYYRSGADTLAKRMYNDWNNKNHFTKISAGAMDKDGNQWFFGKHLYCFDKKTTKIYNEKQGLCNDSLIVSAFSYFKGSSKFCNNSVAIDNKGIPWIFSKNNAYRFNGKTFDSYPIKLPYPCNTVFEDSIGRIWIETAREGMIYCYDQKKLKEYPLQENPEARLWGEIAEDSNGHIFFSTDKGLFEFEKTKITKRNDLPLMGLFGIEIDKRNNLVLWGSTKGVFIYDGEKTTKVKELNNIVIREITIDAENNYWVATSDGLFKIRPVPVSNLNLYEQFGAGVNQYFQMIDSKNHVWVNINKTLYSYNGDSLTKIKEVKHFGTGVFEAKDGKVYIFEPGPEEQNYHYESVHCYDTDGSIKEIKTPSVKQFFNQKIPSDFNFIFPWQEHALCIVMQSTGIFIFDGQEIKKEFSFSVPSACYQLDSSHIIIAHDKVLQEYNLITKKLTDIPNPGDFYQAVQNQYIVYDKNKTLWNYNFKGKYIEECHGTTIIKHGPSDSLIHYKKNLLNYFTNEKRDQVYFLTDLGITILYIEEGKKLRSEFIAVDFQGRFNMPLIAKDGTIWLCNDNGILSINLSDRKNLIKQYNSKNGMFETNCYQLHEDSNNNIWAYTHKGYVKIKREENYSNTIAPPLYVTGVRLFYEKVDLTPFSDSISAATGLPVNLILPYAKNHITFDFAALCFTQNDLVHYKFMLEGAENNWQTETMLNTATYSNLSPGNYTFKLLSCNNDGVWNKEPVTFSFSVLAPWYRTNWAYAGYIIGFISIVGGFSNFRTRQLKERQQELEKTVKEKTAEVVAQKDFIEEKQKEIIDSITYARRIQRSLLPTETYIQKSIDRLKKKGD